MRPFKTLIGAVALTALVTPGARADEANKLTYLTFSGAVQLPGMMLPAGTYEFKLADPSANRRVVQVTDKESKKMYGLLLTIPNRRAKPSDDPVVMFSERPSGEQPAVQVWFYPGETYGYEFVYPKNQAVKIAQATHTPVATFAKETAAESDALAGADVVHVNESGEIERESSEIAQNRGGEQNGATTSTPEPSANRTPPSSPAPQPVATSGQSADQEPATTTNRAPASSTQQPAATNARSELPRTASPLGLIELFAGLSLVGGLGVRQLRRRYQAS
jgi:hypothetical protein